MKSWISEFSVLKVCKTNAISVFNQVVSEANKLKKNIITLDAIYEMKQATLHPLQPQTPHLTPSPVWLGQESSPRCGFFFPFFLFFPLSEVGHKDLAVWRGVGVLNFTDLEVSL